jgi:hypothetical protein
MLFIILKKLNIMIFTGEILYPPKQSRGEHHEGHGENSMVDGTCPKKFVFPLEECLPAPLPGGA